MLEYLSAVQIKIVKDYFCYELLNFKLKILIRVYQFMYIHLILSHGYFSLLFFWYLINNDNLYENFWSIRIIPCNSPRIINLLPSIYAKSFC